MFQKGKDKIIARFGGAFFRNIALLMSGTVIAQIITAASMPVLSRLFLPAAFGVLGMLNSIVNITAGISALRFDMAVMIPKEEKEAANLLGLSLFLVSATSLFLAILLPLLGGQIAEVLNSPELAPWLLVAPVLVLITGAYQSLTYWSSRQKEFRRLSTVTVSASGASAGAKILAGLAGLKTLGLIGGQVLGQALACLLLAFQVWRGEGRKIVGLIERKTLWAVARKYRDFPKYNAPVTLLNGLTNGTPILLFGVFFGPAVAGFYSVAYLILKMPVQLVTNSIRQVYLQRSSERRNQGKSLFKDQWQLTALLAALGAIPMFAAALAAPLGFEWVLGAEWRESGVYAQALMIYLFTMLIGVPSTALIPVLNLQRGFFIWQVLTLTLSATGIVLGSLQGSPVLGVALFAAAKAAMMFLLIAVVAYWTRREDKNPTESYSN